jgi:hypothetical protein
MSGEHRRITMQFVTHCPEHAFHNVLQGRNGFELAKSVIQSGRAYWTKDSVRPLKWSHPCQATLVWTVRRDKLFSPGFSIADSPDFVAPLSPPLCFFALTATARPVDAPVPVDVGGEWTAPHPPMDHQAALDFCRVLGARHRDVVLPIPPSPAAAVKQNVAPIPCLLICAKMLHGNTPNEEDQTIPVVKLSFDYGVASVLPADGRQNIIATRDGVLIQCDRDDTTESKVMERLQSIGFSPLDEIDPLIPDMAKKRDWFLSLACQNDWAILQSSVFPELIREGWRIDHEAGGHITAIDDAAWYTELESNPKGWFELGVGIRIGETRISLLPVIHQFLAQNRNRSIEDIRRLLVGRQITVALKQHGFVLISGDRILVKTGRKGTTRPLAGRRNRAD